MPLKQRRRRPQKREPTCLGQHVFFVARVEIVVLTASVLLQQEFDAPTFRELECDSVTKRFTEDH